MKVTDITRRALAARRQRRNLLLLGFEEVGESGGLLWQLHRGARQHHRIVAAVIAADGKSLFIKTAPDVKASVLDIFAPPGSTSAEYGNLADRRRP